MMEHTLRHYSERQADQPVELIADLVSQMRPGKHQHSDHAVHAIQALCHVLHNHPEYVTQLRTAILTLLGQRKPVSLIVDAGIHPNSGFFSELSRRVGHKFLPEAVDPAYLKDLFGQIFSAPDDDRWVLVVPDDVWLQLLTALRLEEASPEELAACRKSLFDAAQVLSYRLSALGLEPELIRNYPELEDHSSPFIMQNTEFSQFLEGTPHSADAIRHILVMLDQCRKIIGKIRRASSQTGTSIRLTFLLQRISQHVQRMELLLDIIARQMTTEDEQVLYIKLLKTLVYAECHKNDVRQHWRENMELLALRVTENASRTGEHYITETRSEYFALLRSAMGAGLIIGIMAMIKVITAGHHYAPLTEAIFFSLNYGLGFVLIHILHFTVATKQPAMTAAAIAASIDGNDGKSKDMDKLVGIIAQTMRSQTVAIIGNVILALPTAMLIAWLIYTLTGHHFVTPEKANKMLADIHPLYSGALFYAAIAGVCLFLSGLIAGYHDNLAIYNRIPQRLRALRWLKRLLGEARLDRVAHYIENNLGALAGNFYFGCLLGGMAAIGVLLGLPIDIRHITFSSAFAGFSFVGLDFAFSWQVLAVALLGIWLIGTMNLVVSFSLALYVAMKSRKVTFAQWRHLITALFKRLVTQPRQFFLPPKRQVASEPAEPA
jgi:site-specific recombinase